jgi:hypothetical protein
MPFDALWNVKKSLNDARVLVAFFGIVSQELIACTSENLRRQMTLANESTHLINNVFAVFVEQTQNILRHSTERIPGAPETPESPGVGVFVVTKSEKADTYTVICANELPSNAVPALKKRLSVIGEMSRAELREHYKHQRKQAVSKQGAGIGLIDMARKSRYPLDYSFEEIGSDASFFILKVHVSGGEPCSTL